MKSPYTKAYFLMSALKCTQLPQDSGYEVAFAGRSNSGKSSVINALCHRRALAHTSKMPGRTQMINFFEIKAQRRLVDLPGYGYAKVSASRRHSWQNLIACYFGTRLSLQGVMLVMDIRHPLTGYDWQMIEWTTKKKFPVHILLTKADKLKRGPGLHALAQVKSKLNDLHMSVQLFSAIKRIGLEQAYRVLDQWLEIQRN